MTIGTSLRIKYKIREAPTEQQAAQWADLVDRLIAQGQDKELAGYSAARQLFNIEDNLVLKAEADTLESLLEQARQK